MKRMKKRALLLTVFTAVVFMALLCACAHAVTRQPDRALERQAPVLSPDGAEDADARKDGAEDAAPSFKLPASLQSIEDEAFDGVAAETVILPEGLRHIGDNAFANADSLTDVYIPPETSYIGQSAFPQSAKLTIHGAEGSYAQKWALKNQVAFARTGVWDSTNATRKNADAQRIPAAQIDREAQVNKPFAIERRARGDTINLRPQVRAELNPIDYRFP